MGGGHFLSPVSMTACIFSALAMWKQCCFQCITLINFLEYSIKPHYIFRAVAAMAANGVCKITCKTVENWLRYQRKNDPPALSTNVGSVLCINNFWSTQSNSAKFYWAVAVVSSRWYLPNYTKNGWELTSELTSKWIYILKYSSKFHTNLINNFWSTRSNSTEFTGQWP